MADAKFEASGAITSTASGAPTARTSQTKPMNSQMETTSRTRFAVAQAEGSSTWNSSIRSLSVAEVAADSEGEHEGREEDQRRIP